MNRKTKGCAAAKSHRKAGSENWRHLRWLQGLPWLSVLLSTGLFVGYWVCSRQWGLKAGTVLYCFSAVGPGLGKDARWPAAVGTSKLWCYLPPLSWSQPIICHMPLLCECGEWDEVRAERHSPCSPEPHGVQVGSRAGLAVWEERSMLTHSRIYSLVCMSPYYCFLHVENSLVFLIPSPLQRWSCCPFLQVKWITPQVVGDTHLKSVLYTLFQPPEH